MLLVALGLFESTVDKFLRLTLKTVGADAISPDATHAEVPGQLWTLYLHLTVGPGKRSHV